MGTKYIKISFLNFRLKLKIQNDQFVNLVFIPKP